MTSDGFELADKVYWVSQANSRPKRKEGVVVRILAPNEEFTQEDRMAYPNLFKDCGVGMPRNHTTYVVQVGNRYYWPRVTHLRLLGKVE